MREDVTIPSTFDLDGWLYRPDGSDTPRPTIVMCHGLAAVKDQFLDDWASRFCEAGFVVVVYDHRGFGKSGGPRLDIDPWAQVRDAQDVISYAQALPYVDEDKIGFWGTSFSGGHAIVLGAIDRRIKSVVAQVPTVDGTESFLRRIPPGQVAERESGYAKERQKIYDGGDPTLLHLLPHDGEPGIWGDPEAVTFFENTQGANPPSFEAKMTVLSTERARDYNPVEFIARVSPTPLLMIVGSHDTVVMTDLVLEAYEKALEPKKLDLFEGAHWTPYEDAVREHSISTATDWFRDTLGLQTSAEAEEDARLAA